MWRARRRQLVVAVGGALLVAACSSEGAAGTTTPVDATGTNSSTLVDASTATAPPYADAGGAASPFDAAAACAASVPEGFDFVAAVPTTVGDVRALSAGPPGTSGRPAPLWSDAFPGADPSSPAAWCTAVDGDRTYAFSAVADDQPSLDLGRQRLDEPPPPGPPRIE